MKAHQLMTRAVATVRAEDALSHAARLMSDRECGCVVVVDAHFQVQGLITDRDICLTAANYDRPLSEIPVRVAWRGEVHSIGPDEDLIEAERLMGLHQVRRLPVVDTRKRLLGVLSLDDIAREARTERDLFAPHVHAREVAETLGQVGRPHLTIPDRRAPGVEG